MFEKLSMKKVSWQELQHALAGEGGSHTMDALNVELGAPEFRTITAGEGIGQKLLYVRDQHGAYYTMTSRGWSSYAGRTFVVAAPEPETEPDFEAEAPFRGSISPRSIVRLLDGCSEDTANRVIREWHAREQQEWRLVIRDRLPQVRYIGSPLYRLYLHSWLVEDVAAVLDMETFEPQSCLFDENLLSLRITLREPLAVGDRKNVYLALELLNSENGSANLSGKFMVYDLLCTNGMYVDLGQQVLFKRAHRSWDRFDVQADIRDAFRVVPEMAAAATSLLVGLTSREITPDHGLELLVQKYQPLSGASDKFLKEIHDWWIGNEPPTAWGLLSAITNRAQRYSLVTRLNHEKASGLLAKMF
jgi:hypothetical protein